MPKLKDFLTKLKEQGKINNQDYDAYLGIVADVELPDAVTKAIEDNFFTMERAAAHKDIHGRIKREVLDPVDNELSALFDGSLKEFLDPMAEGELKKEANTYNKLKLLSKLVPDAIAKSKVKPGTDEDTKKKIADLEANNRELIEKNSTAEKTYNEQLAAYKKTAEKELHDFKLDTELQMMGNKFTLAEAYDQNRKAISKVILSEIKASNSLKLGEKDGQPFIEVFDLEGKTRFNGNTAVTIDSLLEEKYKPFLKQSNGSGGQERQQQQTTTVKGGQQNPAIRRGASTTIQ